MFFVWRGCLTTPPFLLCYMLPVNTVHCLDCFSFFKEIDDSSVDLIVTDPPYNMGKGDWDTWATHADFMAWTCKWIDEAIRVLKPTGSLYIFNTPYNSAFILQHLLARQMVYQNWITWDKRDGSTPNARRFARKSEIILFFTKTAAHTFNTEAAREPYIRLERIALARKSGLKYGHKKNGEPRVWFPNPNGALVRDVWWFPSNKSDNRTNGKINKQFHPTQKPIELLKRIIAVSSNSGDLVVDCFVGSGTTAVAAQQLERNYICSDMNPEYAAYTIDRLRSERFPSINKPLSLL